ncbi:MAG TPA: aspartate aminotransferase family protein [Acidimicrobiales bacterium]|nr:aspartate aminotransferase family protein [Acidimicrobiales bacterium]
MTASPGAHAELAERHRKVAPAWLGLYYDEPIELVSGEGCRVRDAEGNEYLDFFGGIVTTTSGHSVPEVVEAIREQAGRLLHCSTLYLIRPMVELAERLARLSTIPDAKVFFVNSGTEANEAALLCCCAARRSNQVLALRNSYHGRSFAAMAVTGNRAWSASSLSPFQVSYVRCPDRVRDPLGSRSDAARIEACVADLVEVIETTTAGDVACLIAEPIQGVGGFTVLPDGLLGAMKQVLDAYGILLVSDEVQTGWGRTGEHFWGFQAHDVVPDLLTVAKGLGNGVAIGGVVGRAAVIDALAAHSISTFGGNPLATRAALANLDYLLAHDLQANAAEVGAFLRAQLERCRRDLPLVGDVRGKGLMIGVELVEPGTTTPAPAAALGALEEARRRGLLVGRGGLHGNVLRLAPPLSLTLGEAAEGARILIASLEVVARQLVGEARP